ncbi:GPI ethanolamine phosphate transferase 2 [Fasciola gigantica]|uniref:GPI ethanolamine phosphate transferase 2 n=1 Tax=Fasciola gigantica TaxID=46835 RepID=A0A504YGR3_FASGI|nr:GPI ethanolamine phosphate transferase 2 [Fasciola gigantica]
MKSVPFEKKRSVQFVLLVFVYYVGLIVFMIGLLPMEDTAYKDEGNISQLWFISWQHPEVSRRTDSGPVTRFVLMIVDGLRGDLILSPQHAKFWRKLEKNLDQYASVRARSFIQPPTVTMPRIKALTSGRVPKFVDVLRNLDTTEMQGETWLSRLVRIKNWVLEFYGDDTWIKLFPNLFKRTDGTNSFFVNDYHEVRNLLFNKHCPMKQVDQNVTRHLKGLFHRPSEWNGVILHYLGLDHIGHVEGPKGSSISLKLAEMDDVVGYILTQLVRLHLSGYNMLSSRSFVFLIGSLLMLSLYNARSNPHLLSHRRYVIAGKASSMQNESWLFVLTGDHGMSDQGGHGGSTFGEVNTGLVIVSSAAKPGPTKPLVISPYRDRYWSGGSGRSLVSFKFRGSNSATVGHFEDRQQSAAVGRLATTSDLMGPNGSAAAFSILFHCTHTLECNKNGR